MVRLYMCRRCIFACPFQHRYWDKRNFIFRFFAAIFSLACFTLTTEETLWNEYPNVTLFIITPRSIIAEIVTSEMQSTNFPSLHTIELCNAIDLNFYNNSTSYCKEEVQLAINHHKFPYFHYLLHNKYHWKSSKRIQNLAVQFSHHPTFKGNSLDLQTRVSIFP